MGHPQLPASPLHFLFDERAAAANRFKEARYAAVQLARELRELEKLFIEFPDLKHDAPGLDPQALRERAEEIREALNRHA